MTEWKGRQLILRLNSPLSLQTLETMKTHVRRAIALPPSITQSQGICVSVIWLELFEIDTESVPPVLLIFISSHFFYLSVGIVTSNSCNFFFFRQRKNFENRPSHIKLDIKRPSRGHFWLKWQRKLKGNKSCLEFPISLLRQVWVNEKKMDEMRGGKAVWPRWRDLLRLSRRSSLFFPMPFSVFSVFSLFHFFLSLLWRRVWR